MGNNLNFECCALTCNNNEEVFKDNANEKSESSVKGGAVKSKTRKRNNNIDKYIFKNYSFDKDDADAEKKLITVQKMVRKTLAVHKMKTIYEKEKKELLAQLIKREINFNSNDIQQFPCEIFYKELLTTFKIDPYSKLDYYKDNIKKYKFSFPSSYTPIPDTNQIYIGSWNVKGKHHGYGVLYTKDGSTRVEGLWTNGVLNGLCRLFKPNEYLICNYINSYPNGEGTYYYSDGSIYNGSFTNGIPNGNGKVTYPDGAFFEGVFVNGEQVYGKSVWKNGDFYQGDLLNDEFNGHGIYEWGANRRYEGAWKNGKMNGKGKITYVDGSYYEGEFMNNVRWGYGKYFWNKDKYYEGEWRNGKQNGNGVYVKNGVTTKGLWINGKLMNRETKGKKRLASNFEMYNTNSSAGKSSKMNQSHNSSIVMSSLDVNSDDQKSARKAVFISKKI